MPRKKKASKGKQRVLLTFVGSRDPFRGGQPNSGDGPLLSLLAVEHFDVVHLFYNNDDYLRRASDLFGALQRRPATPEVSYEEIAVINPTDYELLYECMQHKGLEIVERHGTDAEFFVSTSSGTPQMQTCWLLLVLGGVLPARLLQVDPPDKVREGESPVREFVPAIDRFPKIESPARLKRELNIATRRAEVLSKERSAMERELAPNLIGTSKAFREVVAAAKRIAEHDTPVLITGETGTGKEEIAKLIHFASPRREQPFLPINCAGLPEQIFESVLFGHSAGAFTDAREDKAGLLEEAGKGTVFLDELGELPLPQQAKLLRVLQDRRFRRIGEAKERTCVARIVAATNRDLEEMVGDGKFRQDLLFRLNVVDIDIPPLRERSEDVLALTEHFLAKYCHKYKRKLRISEAALEYLRSLPWDGNVRELQHMIERVVLSLPDGEILAKHLKKPTRRKKKVEQPIPLVALSDTPIDLPQIIEDWERVMIERAIERFQNNRSAAARHLGYEEATLRKKARKYFGAKREGRQT